MNATDLPDEQHFTKPRSSRLLKVRFQDGKQRVCLVLAYIQEPCTLLHGLQTHSSTLESPSHDQGYIVTGCYAFHSNFKPQVLGGISISHLLNLSSIFFSPKTSLEAKKLTIRSWLPPRWREFPITLLRAPHTRRGTPWRSTHAY